MSDDERPLLDIAEHKDPLPENVLEFRKREAGDDERLEQLAKSRTALPCGHKHKRWIDADQRIVTCGECGATLDPIWCLLNLVEYRESLRREREAIVFERQQLEKRRHAAIARRQATVAKRELEVAAANCEACSGTGWRVTAAGAVRCACRKGRGAAMF